MTTAAPVNTELDRELALGKRRRQRREALIALLFVAPATIITFVFGIWPVIFGLFVSLHQWRARTHSFLGLDQYVRALGNFAYVLAFLLTLLFAFASYRALRRARAAERESGASFVPFLLPGGVLALGSIAFAIGFAAQLGEWMLVGLALLAVGGFLQWRTGQRGDQLSVSQYGLLAWQAWLFGLLALGLFVFTLSEILGDTSIPFQIVAQLAPELYIPPLSQQMLAAGVLALALAAIIGLRWVRDHLLGDVEDDPRRAVLRLVTFLLWVLVVVLFIYLVAAFQFDQAAAAAVQEVDRNKVGEIGQAITGLERSEYRSLYGSLSGNTLAGMLVLWPQVVSIAIGFLLMFIAYRTWRSAARQDGSLGMVGFMLLAITLAVGGWLLIGEIPQAMAIGDTEYYNSLVITTAYAIGTVPVQLGLGIFLAYLMFYEVSIGKSFYRMVYFMPYIAPTVATATVFGIIFSSRDYSLANRTLGLLGIPAQNWLLESKGVFQIIAELIAGPGIQLPDFLVGPSLALVAIILYNIWVFAGYNAVIFLAGLGAIPGDLYEAAKVDGAGRWAAFRKITFPLLSPTTFFLTILGITGTFRAFTHVYVMRQAAARGSADTASVHIFVQFWQFNQWGYASAMAFVLFGIILILTLVQNEASKGRVFYG